MSRFDPQIKLALAPQFSAYMAGQKVYPVGLEISPFGACQATCPFCWYARGAAGSHRNTMIPKERLITLFMEGRYLGIKAITWTGGGEPSLHPQIFDLVDGAAAYDYRQGMFTNALAMPRYDPSLLDWIRVTMTDKPWKRECIEPLRACKTLGFAFNYAGESDKVYLWQTLKLAEQVKADYVQVRPALAFGGKTVNIQPPDVNHPIISHPLMIVTDYKFKEAKHRHGYGECEGYHFVPFLWEDGNLDVCAYMRERPGYTLGNIYKDSLKDILDRAPVSVPVIGGCQVCCKLHEINQMVNRARMVKDREFP